MTYLPYPPYEILANDLIDFTAMQDLKRMARFWDLLYNSGNFNGIVSAQGGAGQFFQHAQLDFRPGQARQPVQVAAKAVRAFPWQPDNQIHMQMGIGLFFQKAQVGRDSGFFPAAGTAVSGPF